MTVLVVGATGTVGREVVRALRERGAKVRALVRSEERAARSLPPDVELSRGDVADPPSIEAALRGASAIFYVSPHERDEEALARNVVAASNAAGVRLVFLGVHADGKSRVSRALQRLVFGAILPHYKPKLRISEYVRRHAGSAVLLVATNFFQNDELYLDEILAGELVTPLSRKGVNRVDVRDIGDAAARALLDPTLPPGAYPVIGPASLSGAESATTWARVLGREVRYTGDDFGRFETAARHVLDGKKLEDILASYGALGKLHIPTDARALEATTKLLGRPPHGYESYVRDTVARLAASGEIRATSAAAAPSGGGAGDRGSISRG